MASLSAVQEGAFSDLRAANLHSWHLRSKLEHHFESGRAAIVTDGDGH